MSNTPEQPAQAGQVQRLVEQQPSKADVLGRLVRADLAPALANGHVEVPLSLIREVGLGGPHTVIDGIVTAWTEPDRMTDWCRRWGLQTQFVRDGDTTLRLQLHNVKLTGAARHGKD